MSPLSESVAPRAFRISFISASSGHVTLNDSSNGLQMMVEGAAVVALEVLLKHVSGGL